MGARERWKIRAKRRFSYISLSDNWRISVARSRDNEGLERGLDVPTGAFCSSSLLFTHPRSLPILCRFFFFFCRPQTQSRAFEKLISLPRLTRFPVREQFLRGVVILCWNNEQGWIDISLQRRNSMLKLEQLVVTSVRQCEILVSCLMKIFERKGILFLKEGGIYLKAYFQHSAIISSRFFVYYI